MSEIFDAWAEIGEHIADGSYKTRYAIGDTKTLNIRIDGKLTIIEMQIAAFDEDTLFDTGSKAAITWISKDIITRHVMNPTPTSKGGWMLSDMRKYCMALYNNILDKDAKELIKPVRKTSYHYETKSSHTTKDYCWIPSMFEVYGDEYGGETGPKYTSLFCHNDACKKCDLAGNSDWWWLRSASVGYDNFFRFVNRGGSGSNCDTYFRGSVVLGFSTSI